jgi:hypothetical protein
MRPSRFGISPAADRRLTRPRLPTAGARTGHPRPCAIPTLAVSTPDSPETPDHPVVVRVTSRRRIEPALVVGVLVLAMLGLALWKPWVDASVAVVSPAPAATGLDAAAASAAPALAAPPPAASPAVAAPAFEPGAAVLPALFGLDLGFMGTTDAHAAWGVAVAYAPSANIARAVSGRLPTFTPVVDWALQAGAGGGPGGVSRHGPSDAGPTMDHPRAVTMAVAVTWPSMPRPRAVRLLRLGTIASASGRIAPLPAAQPIQLSEALPLLVRVASPGSDAFDAAPSDRWALTSGTFFLPSHGPPGDVGGWLTGGWRPGAYAFVVTQADGSTRTLPFVLRG